MYTLYILKDSAAAKYKRLTFPILRPLLGELKSRDSLIAIGASSLGQPVGLILGQLLADSRSSEVLSLFVADSYRGHGMGSDLLARLESELSQRGCNQAELTYRTGKPTTPALERLLSKRKWASPQLRNLVCKATDRMMDAPWIERYVLPPSFTIFPWTELTQAERLSIQQRQLHSPWIPQDLIPFQYEENLESLNSLGLRYQGEVVGWVITHRLARDLIRYTCSFVRQDLQKMGRMIPLVAEAIKYQYKANILKAIWTVSVKNIAMVNFVRRRMADYLQSLEESRVSFKLL